ncbi:unnamed protein product [Calypogeia fissa]
MHGELTDWGISVRHTQLNVMTALVMQELSVKLSLYTRSVHLSTLRRKSSTSLYRQNRNLHICACSSSSSLSSLSSSCFSSFSSLQIVFSAYSTLPSRPVVDSHFPFRLFGRLLSFRPLSAAPAAGTDDFRVCALGRSDHAEPLSSKTDDLAFSGDLKLIDYDDDDDDNVDSPAEDLVSDADCEETEENEDKEVANESEQLDDSFGYVKFVEKEGSIKEVAAPNYLAMTDKQLFAQCRMDTYRASGPGGQHRNKTDSAVRLTHIPTGLVSQAADDRSQHINRSLALTRLRQIVALEVRHTVELEGYNTPLELVRILPSGTGGKRGNSQKIGPNHPDFILGMKALMDLLYATGGSVSDAGKILGITTGALSKLITSNNLLWQGVNKLRSSKGLKPLR